MKLRLVSRPTQKSDFAFDLLGKILKCDIDKTFIIWVRTGSGELIHFARTQSAHLSESKTGQEPHVIMVVRNQTGIEFKNIHL